MKYTQSNDILIEMIARDNEIKIPGLKISAPDNEISAIQNIYQISTQFMKEMRSQA